MRLLSTLNATSRAVLATIYMETLGHRLPVGGGRLPASASGRSLARFGRFRRLADLLVGPLATTFAWLANRWIIALYFGCCCLEMLICPTMLVFMVSDTYDAIFCTDTQGVSSELKCTRGYQQV